MLFGRAAFRRCIGFGVVVFFNATASAYAATRLADLAPADFYFGRAHMSPIEVSNRIRHGAEAVRRDRLEARRDLGMLLLAQEAIEDWASRYPRDPWIARDERKLAAIFVRIGMIDARSGARRCDRVLAHTGHLGSVSHPVRVANAKPKRKHHRFLGFM